MATVRPGWLVSLFAAGLSVGSWLPWLTTPADGGGRASAIGGTLGTVTVPSRFGVGQLIVLSASVLIVLGAMVARNLAPRAAAVAAVALSVLVGVLTWWFYRTGVVGAVVVGYGFYLGVACAVGALGCSIWALASTLTGRTSGATTVPAGGPPVG